jgi:hypothetical protein
MRSRGIAVILACVVGLHVFSLVAGQEPVTTTLLACRMLKPDPSTQRVIQFERETFPPFVDTGVFQTQGQELLYIEQGFFTVFSDQEGEQFRQLDQTRSFLAAPGSALGVRNDDGLDGSLLWLRLTEPTTFATPSAYLSTAALSALTAQIGFDEPVRLPLFIEFDGPDSAEETALFIVALEMAPGSEFTSADSERLTASGRIAIVVETGELSLDDDTTQTVFSGEWTVIDGDQQYAIANDGDERMYAFVVGFVAPDDVGVVGKLIADNCPHLNEGA